MPSAASSRTAAGAPRRPRARRDGPAGARGSRGDVGDDEPGRPTGMAALMAVADVSLVAAPDDVVAPGSRRADRPLRHGPRSDRDRERQLERRRSRHDRATSRHGLRRALLSASPRAGAAPDGGFAVVPPCGHVAGVLAKPVRVRAAPSPEAGRSHRRNHPCRVRSAGPPGHRRRRRMAGAARCERDPRLPESRQRRAGLERADDVLGSGVEVRQRPPPLHLPRAVDRPRTAVGGVRAQRRGHVDGGADRDDPSCSPTGATARWSAPPRTTRSSSSATGPR